MRVNATMYPDRNQDYFYPDCNPDKFALSKWGIDGCGSYECEQSSVGPLAHNLLRISCTYQRVV